MLQISSIFPVFGAWERHPLQAAAGATEIRNELTRKLRAALAVAGSSTETGCALETQCALLSPSPTAPIVAPSQI